MKFILMIQICSIISSTCMPPIKINPGYEEYSKCTLDGYSKSLEFLKGLDEKTINEEQIYTKFYCNPITIT
jgi:hypothetical protein